jgi:hypothetical protein
LYLQNQDRPARPRAAKPVKPKKQVRTKVLSPQLCLNDSQKRAPRQQSASSDSDTGPGVPYIPNYDGQRIEFARKGQFPLYESALRIGASIGEEIARAVPSGDAAQVLIAMLDEDGMLDVLPDFYLLRTPHDFGRLSEKLEAGTAKMADVVQCIDASRISAAGNYVYFVPHPKDQHLIPDTVSWILCHGLVVRHTET